MNSRTNRNAASRRPGAPGPVAQLQLPLGKPGPHSDREAVSLGRRVVMVEFVRNRRARRYILRVLADGHVRLTVPRSGSRAHALAFLRRELGWVDRQRYTAARNANTILVRGETVPLEVDQAPAIVRFGGEQARLRRGETARQAASRRLREVASRELRERLAVLAARFKLTVTRVTIRSQQTRWGSCSPDGSIALNWRLVQMPDSVRDYILIHELMHLRERNHSHRFWALVEQACPEHRAARRWLKAHEGELL